MKIRILFFLFLGLGMILQQSCSDKVTVIPISYYQLSDEFKSYCLFETGSKWEYQSTNLGQAESVTVVNVETNIWQNTFGETFNYEAIDMQMDDNEVGISMIEITAGSTKDSTADMNSLMWMFYSDGDYRLVFAPGYPLGEEQLLGDNEGVYENVEIIPTMQVGGNNYEDIYHTRVTDYYENGMGDFDFYLAKNHGLIKMQNIVNGDTIIMQLENSSLIQ